MKQCSICGEQFENGRIYSNHVRWKHKVTEHTCKFCDYKTTCNIGLHEDNCSFNPKNIRKCKHCSNILTSVDQTQFCSHKCSASYNNQSRTITTKTANCVICNIEIELKSKSKKYCNTCKFTVNKEKNKQYIEKYKACRSNKPNIKCYELTCVICNERFLRFNKNIKTCSSACKSRLLSQLSKQNPNCGGETNYKRYSYKNIIFDSSWEVEIAMFLDEHQIKWSRSRKHILYWVDSSGERRRYYPDFFLEEFNAYVDPKNPFKQKQDKEKLDFIRKSHILIVGNINECKQQILEIISPVV